MFIHEYPQDESGYFFTADYLWDSFKELFEISGNVNIYPIIEQENLNRPVLESDSLHLLPVFKGILLLNTLSRFSSQESVRETCQTCKTVENTEKSPHGNPDLPARNALA